MTAPGSPGVQGGPDRNPADGKVDVQVGRGTDSHTVQEHDEQQVARPVPEPVKSLHVHDSGHGKPPPDVFMGSGLEQIRLMAGAPRFQPDRAAFEDNRLGGAHAWQPRADQQQDRSGFRWRSSGPGGSSTV